MGVHRATLILATFLCSLVAGFLFAFAVVAMPGIGKLRDRDFLRAFRAMDRIIQDNQPLFMLVWIGSVLALVAAVGLAFGNVDGITRLLLIAALLAYLLGVQLPTIAINVPLNNRLQAMDVERADAASHETARGSFEGRWNSSNRFRAAVACLVSLTLMVVLTTM